MYPPFGVHTVQKRSSQIKTNFNKAIQVAMIRAMKKHLLSLFFLLCILPFLRSQDIENLEKFETWLESKLTYEKWPGAVVGIVKDQELVWVGAYGFADLENRVPMDTSLYFSIASNTKMLTALGIAKLRRQGHLHFDDPVYEHVPEILNIQTVAGAHPKDITIRHLLTHTSGLPVEPWYFNWEVRPAMDEIISNLDKQTLGIPTSVDFKYSNLGYSLLGRTIETISGRSYQDFMKEEVLRPVGMHDSHFKPAEGIPYARGYQPLFGKVKREPVKLLEYQGWAPGGGLYSNLDDLFRFVAWFIRTYDNRDSTLVDAATLRGMTRVSWVSDSWDYGVGLGFFIYKGEEKMVGHGGHNPGFKTDVTILPESRLGIITLTNGEDMPYLPDDEKSIPAQVIKYIVPHFRDSRPGKKQPYNVNEELYEGIYTGYWGDYKVYEAAGVLTISRITNDRPDLFQLKIAPAGLHTFRVFSEDIGRWRGEMIYFREMKNGQMQTMLMDGTTFYRKE